MISTKLTLQSYTLVLIVFTIFSVSLTENLQLADGFRSQSTAGWSYELNPGESQVGTWTLRNIEEVPINIEFSVENKGSEFFVFEKVITFEPNEKKAVEFIVTIPDDHPDNVEYHVKLNALEKAPTPEGGAAAVMINYQMFANAVIKIGDDPVFTPEPKPVKIEEKSEAEVVKEEISEEDFSAAPEPETLQEKLDRINKANEDIKVDDEFEEPFEESFEDNYIEEPVMDKEPVAEINAVDNMGEEKIECDFFAMILSWFGFGKC